MNGYVVVYGEYSQEYYDRNYGRGFTPQNPIAGSLFCLKFEGTQARDEAVRKGRVVAEAEQIRWETNPANPARTFKVAQVENLN